MASRHEASSIRCASSSTSTQGACARTHSRTLALSHLRTRTLTHTNTNECAHSQPSIEPDRKQTSQRLRPDCIRQRCDAATLSVSVCVCLSACARARVQLDKWRRCSYAEHHFVTSPSAHAACRGRNLACMSNALLIRRSSMACMFSRNSGLRHSTRRDERRGDKDNAHELRGASIRPTLKS
eukprot:6176078-Pleurochrysis_carterae.AAC.1